MITNIPKVIDRIVEELRNFSDMAVVGLSGGVDSTVVACLCKLAYGEKNVHAVHMPYGDTDTDTVGKFNSNSLRIAEKLEVESHWKPITKIADAINEVATSFCNEFYTLSNPLSDVNMGNSRSRARMCVLYSLAHHIEQFSGKRVRVIGTGNLSEDWIGYDTKGGDALADIFPIGQLFKSEVYQLAEYFVSVGMIDEDMIDRTPSAGLEEGQTDEGDLGFTYDQMEPAIKFWMDREGDYYPYDQWNDYTKTEVDDFVLDRHKKHKHKHEAPKVVNLRDMYVFKYAA